MITSQTIQDILTLVDWLGATKAPTNRAQAARERLEVAYTLMKVREELHTTESTTLIGDAQGGGQ